ncbi:hypothetical protein [Melittangium boletus]|uniref:Uncharacterized protein n=1 Tax=Melittangium boletus DSM 14713 TaxID=1294270 RepID=A0A250IBH1_9BACT|nr:hypothetical protein [Melittangium boletus]ATB29204.1 hypothetical protein MEBOL_002653 [Melittangium boletus DSM 14713]
MPYSYDYFAAELTCPVCGETSPADHTTNMQTYLRDNPERALLPVGAPLPLDTERIRQKKYEGYLTAQVPRPGAPIHILQTWECPFCGAPANWAEVTVSHGVIERMAAVEFDRDHFERSHLIANDALGIAMDLTGKTAQELVKMDLVQILRDRL